VKIIGGKGIWGKKSGYINIRYSKGPVKRKLLKIIERANKSKVRAKGKGGANNEGRTPPGSSIGGYLESGGGAT